MLCYQTSRANDGGITWTATLTPNASATAASNVLTLDYTGIADLAGNPGTGNATSGNYAVDTTRPTATIVVTDDNLTVGETSLVTITFSEAVTGFTNADLSIANATLSAVSSSGGGITWTATLTPDANIADTTNTVTLDNAGVVDIAGNAGTGTTNSNNYAIDTAPPLLNGTLPGQTTTDAAALLPFDGVTISDAGVDQVETVTVTLSDHLNGTLSNLGGGAYDASSGVYSVTGSAAAVSTAIAGLTFTPTAHQVAPGSAITTGFTIIATNTAGATNSDNATTVIATSVNDPPVIAGTEAGQPVSDITTVTPFAEVTISDPDVGPSETVTITLTAGGTPSDANGVLSGVGLTETGADTGIYTLAAGTPDAVSAALRALVFTPTAHEVAPGSTVTTGLTLSVDDGLAGSPSTNTTTTVIAAAVDNLPAIILPATTTGVPNQVQSTPFAGVVIVDTSTRHPTTVTVTLSDPAGGALSNLGGGGYDNGTGVYTIIGTTVEVTAALEALVFTPAPAASRFVNTVVFTIGVVGLGGSVSDSSISVTSAQQVVSLGTCHQPVRLRFRSAWTARALPRQWTAKLTKRSSATPAPARATNCRPGIRPCILGGTADATLTDGGISNALLVGNSGNNTLGAAGDGATLLSGSGENQLIASGSNALVLATSGTNTITASGDQATIVASGTANILATGTGHLVFGSFGSTLQGALALQATGGNATISAGSSAVTATVQGAQTLVFGGTSAALLARFRSSPRVTTTPSPPERFGQHSRVGRKRADLRRLWHLDRCADRSSSRRRCHYRGWDERCQRHRVWQHGPHLWWFQHPLPVH